MTVTKINGDRVAVEQRTEGVVITTRYPWSDSGDIGLRTEHIEIKYRDLPALVKELLGVMGEHCSIEQAAGVIGAILAAAGR